MIITPLPTPPDAARFAHFMEQIELYAWDFVGCSVADLADFDYRGSFDAGDTPAQTLAKALLNEEL